MKHQPSKKKKNKSVILLQFLLHPSTSSAAVQTDWKMSYKNATRGRVGFICLKTWMKVLCSDLVGTQCYLCSLIRTSKKMCDVFAFCTDITTLNDPTLESLVSTHTVEEVVKKCGDVDVTSLHKINLWHLLTSWYSMEKSEEWFTETVNAASRWRLRQRSCRKLVGSLF